MTHQANPRIRLGIYALLLAMAGLAQAATITVGPGTDCDFDTIQAGIDAAVDGDTVLVAPGEYVITEPVTFRGKAVTVRSEAGRDETTIRMGTPTDINRGSVVVFENNETPESILAGFTLTGGKGCWRTEPYPPRKSWWLGGGIFCSSTSSTIVSCTMIKNTAEHGGGVFAWEESSPILANCLIKDNSATESGGGVFLGSRSSLTMTDCIIRGNSAETSGSGGGIFFYKGSSLIMTDCIITGNTAHYGGGIKCEYGLSAVLTRCIVADNTSGTWGGGLEVVYGSASINNCTIARNMAIETGGGMWCGDGTATVTNCIIWQNTASYGREISLEVTSVLDIACSDVAGSEASVYVDGSSTLDWGVGNIDADPLFGRLGYSDDKGTRDPADDVWVAGDYHLKSQAGRWDPNSGSWVQDDLTSPCIDAGDPDSDWTGETWPHGRRINMGAYGGTREASMSARAEAMSLPRVAFIYRSDPEAAESFQSLLMRYGCPTTLIGIDDVETEALDAYDVIIVASDAGYSSTWQDTPFVATIEDSGKPIIGLGQGGYNFFGVLELWIGRPYGGHGGRNSIEVMDPNGSLFSTPYSIDIPDDRALQLYTETDHIGIYLWPTIPETVTVFGSEVNNEGYYPLVMEHNRYLFWGFMESPLKMTEVGKTLFINVVIWTANAGWEIEI